MENKNVDTQKSRTRSAMVILGKTALTLAAAAVILLAGSLLGLLLSSEGIALPFTYMAGYLLPALLLPLIWLKKRKKYVRIWLAIAALCFVVLAADFAVVKHDRAIQVDTARYLHIIEDFTEYLPFEEDSRIVNIKSETLQLTEDLPVIDGTVAFYPLFSAFVNAVYPETTEFYVGSFDHVQSWGYETMAEKETDIFISLAYPTGTQKENAESAGVTFEYTTIGTEALVFITHKDNPIDNLTTEQLRGIYSGEITNWKELGGKNKKIEAYQNETGSSPQSMVERFMGETPLMEAPAVMTYDSLYAWVEETAGYRNKANSIGFSFRYCVKDNPDIKFLSVDGVAPTQENIKNGSYPVVTPVFAVTYEENTNENVDKMLDWILSEEGQYIVEGSGYAGVVSED